MALATDVEAQTIEYIASTRRDRYFIFTQPGLQAADFQHMPKLRQRVSKLKDGESAYVQIPEVVGGVSVEKMAASMVGKMGVGDTGGMREQEMPALSASMSKSDRADAVAMTDDYIGALLAEMEDLSIEPYLFIFAGEAAKSGNGSVEDHRDLPYEMDEPYPTLHTDLKRDTRTYHVRQANSSAENPQSHLPLFEKYKFLSPALFMGLTVSLILFSILYVGVSAIAGLEVSYAAFSKEMGPQAQNKGKQQ
ncbi:hypothetical protein LTR57_019663 [Friedmanniomyces endolithicus]|nr:hypothetical protein LTR59_004682 [Friedmanniomyces endolithicus]KAK0819167.1 hypothetical protein LTR38_000610 [Friedmanniomyces endolithicus]KAK0821696.1 hypothetical protein LTR75_000353 [Friedmanniomyces endolithicus]KAK0848063.1 hypothetical protein LTR03_005962 [Friedmanniomyces endolithicus]KAK0885475.1 hypothetical protein LTR87_000670 [Friedmanniomyces endolithicus]